MSKFHKSIVIIFVLCWPLWVGAQQSSDHNQHQHETPATTKNPGANQLLGKMDQQMKMMLDMHQKMEAAKTPEDRQKLLDEHKKVMKDGMDMMQQMKPGMGMNGQGMYRPKPTGERTEGAQGGYMPSAMMQRQQMMEKRMAMMESMMQMLMDAMPPTK